MSKEIVTLQIGSLSNLVGTHFWNNSNDLFDSENSKILYRNGIESFAPRVVCIDFKGSGHPVYSHGGDDELEWTGNVLKVEKSRLENSFISNLNSQDPDQKSFASELENIATVPADFSKVYYHPKSVFPIQQNFYGFDDFNQGVDVWQNEEWVFSLKI